MDENESKHSEPCARDASISLNEIDASFVNQKNHGDAFENIRDDDEDKRNFIIPITKKLKIRIYKPLILLKLALFIWYGAASILYTFIYVFFKQKGITVTELSRIYAIIPFAQFLGASIFGIIADKLGRSKPAFAVLLLLNVVFITAILLSPDMNVMNCHPQPIQLECHHQEHFELIAGTSCGGSSNVTEFTSCNAVCSKTLIQHCSEQKLICDLLQRIENESNSRLVANVNSAYTLQGKCYYNITSISHRNTMHSLCTLQDEMNCTISCLINPSDNCFTSGIGRTGIVILNAIFFILLFMVFSTTYRIIDVTVMTLVKEHNADFGCQRVFAMFGAFVSSSSSGYLITASAINQDDKNYKTGLYVYIAMIIVLFVVMFKIKVQIKPPGKNMWKKSLYLLKKPDVIAFALVLIVLGSNRGFVMTLLYWHLEEIGASSSLLGLINGLSALYGLPFLFTSNWWIKTVGTRQLIILGLLGYVTQGILYSFLYDPRFSLFVQVTDIFTYHLLWVTVVVHCHSLAPEGLTATVIAVAGGIHFNLGFSAGTFVGGYLTNVFGSRVTFRVMASLCLTTAVLYAVYLYARKTVQKKNDSASNQDNSKIETELMKVSANRSGSF